MGDPATADRYRIVERIGEGVHGVVLRAVDQQHPDDGPHPDQQRQVAIKKIALRNKYGDISLNALREIKVLQHCDHPNVFNYIRMLQIRIDCESFCNQNNNIADSLAARHVPGFIRHRIGTGIYTTYFVHENEGRCAALESGHHPGIHRAIAARFGVYARSGHYASSKFCFFLFFN